MVRKESQALTVGVHGVHANRFFVSAQLLLMRLPAMPVVAFDFRTPRIAAMSMIHENLPASIEDLSARIIAIRDSL